MMENQKQITTEEKKVLYYANIMLPCSGLIVVLTIPFLIGICLLYGIDTSNLANNMNIALGNLGMKLYSIFSGPIVISLALVVYPIIILIYIYSIVMQWVYTIKSFRSVKIDGRRTTTKPRD